MKYKLREHAVRLGKSYVRLNFRLADAALGLIGNQFKPALDALEERGVLSTLKHQHACINYLNRQHRIHFRSQLLISRIRMRATHFYIQHIDLALFDLALSQKPNIVKTVECKQRAKINPHKADFLVDGGGTAYSTFANIFPAPPMKAPGYYAWNPAERSLR